MKMSESDIETGVADQGKFDVTRSVQDGSHEFRSESAKRAMESVN